jgi:hypothetical protein
MGKDKSAAGILSGSSAHKHIINALWLFGLIGLEDPDLISTASTCEYYACALVLPILLQFLYLQFALRVKDPATAPDMLAWMGIAMPDDSVNARSSDSKSDGDATAATPSHPHLLGNVTVVPGEWIYSAFKSATIRKLFVVGPMLCAPAALGLARWRGACFRTGFRTRGCHWFPLLLA